MLDGMEVPRQTPILGHAAVYNQPIVWPRLPISKRGQLVLRKRRVFKRKKRGEESREQHQD